MLLLLLLAGNNDEYDRYDKDELIFYLPSFLFVTGYLNVLRRMQYRWSKKYRCIYKNKIPDMV